MAGKKFRFSLESVLKLRKHETNVAREELAWLMQQKQLQIERVEAAQTRLHDFTREGLRGVFDSTALRQYDAFRNDALQCLDENRKKLQLITNKEEEARSTVMKKRSAQEALQRLYEKEESKHKKESETADIEFLDEQAITSYFRQRQGANS